MKVARETWTRIEAKRRERSKNVVGGLSLEGGFEGRDTVEETRLKRW